MSMITDEQFKAALAAWNDGVGTGTVARMRAALEAAERAAWRPISEAPKNGELVMAWDIYGARPAYFDAAPTLEDFLDICDEGEGLREYEEYLAENPGLGWVSFREGEIEYFDPTHFRPLPTPPVPHE